MIAVAAAMSVEVEPLLREMRDARTETISRAAFTRGTLAGRKVALAVVGVGKVNAAIGACGTAPSWF